MRRDLPNINLEGPQAGPATALEEPFAHLGADNLLQAHFDGLERLPVRALERVELQSSGGIQGGERRRGDVQREGRL